jgi:hypothetical protein
MAKRIRKQTLIQSSRGIGAEQKAIYHNITGAGRGHVIREFFGLSADDERELTETIERAIDERLARL